MDTAVSPIDIPLLPTPSTSSASPSVELRHDFEVLSSNATDFSSAHTSPDDARNSHAKDCEVMCPESKNLMADTLKIPQRKLQKFSTAVVYESQISPELGGIKLKIKKSPTQDVLHQSTSATSAAGQKNRAKKTVRLKTPRARKPTVPNAKGRKRKRKKKGQSDDESEEDRDDRRKVHFNTNGSAMVDDGDHDSDSGHQSIWANERMPPEILSKIFMEVTYTEGCVPTLVR